MEREREPGGAVDVTIEEEEAPFSAEGTMLELLLADHEARSIEPEQARERIEICAEKEIVLRCGKASITLTRSGKILIRGTYVLSRSSGAQRIQGASVQIN